MKIGKPATKLVVTFSPLLLTIALFLAFLVPQFYTIFPMYRGLGHHRLPYLLFYFTMITVAEFICYRFMRSRSFLLWAAIGCLWGQIASTISLILASLIMPNGFALMAKEIHISGICLISVLYVTVAFALLGWLFGLCMFVFARTMVREGADEGTPAGREQVERNKLRGVN